MSFWLMKSEPEVYSIDNLKKDKATLWEGVRNYQARNFMMQSMQPEDEVLFYHSNAVKTGVAGLAKVAGPALPDPTQFDKKSDYFDPKATKEKPRWFCVTLEFTERFSDVVTLESLKKISALKDMPLLAKGQRLSVQPCTEAQFKKICDLGRSTEDGTAGGIAGRAK